MTCADFNSIQLIRILSNIRNELEISLYQIISRESKYNLIIDTVFDALGIQAAREIHENKMNRSPLILLHFFFVSFFIYFSIIYKSKETFLSANSNEIWPVANHAINRPINWKLDECNRRQARGNPHVAPQEDFDWFSFRFSLAKEKYCIFRVNFTRINPNF